MIALFTFCGIDMLSFSNGSISKLFSFTVHSNIVQYLDEYFSDLIVEDTRLQLHCGALLRTLLVIYCTSTYINQDRH